jgi:hypothetical protein
MELHGEELKEAKAIFDKALATRPHVTEKPFAEFTGA